MNTYDLSELSELTKALREAEGGGSLGAWFDPIGDLHCSACGGSRRVKVEQLAGNLKAPPGAALAELQGRSNFRTPAMFSLTCLQCGSVYLALVYSKSDRDDLVIVPQVDGGIRTPNTPVGVSFYLDQAARSESMGARSAAVAMYRAALEHLLYEQEFTNGMLATKISALEGRILSGNAPRWARDLNPEFLKLVKDLGNGVIHPNDGDVERQSAIDNKSLRSIHVLFAELLDRVYEEKHRRDAHLAELRSANDELNT